MQSLASLPPLGPYDDLSREGKTLVEYVWIASSEGSQLRSKTRVLDHHPTCVEEVPIIVVEGSSDDSTAAEGNELCLKPRKVFPDPFRGNGHLLVLCDSFTAQVMPPDEHKCGLTLPTLRPHPSNTRVPCQEVMAHASPKMIAFAFQQEYVVRDPQPQAVSHAPPRDSQPAYISPANSQPMSCSSVKEPRGAEAPLQPLSLAARKLAERHLMTCLRAGINISEISQRTCTVRPLDSIGPTFGFDRIGSGTTAPEVWTYKVGPNLGIDTADQLWMSRFLLMRSSELDGLNVSFEPHATGDPAYGLRCCTECSTEATRHPANGLAELERHVALLHVAQLQYGPPQYSPANPRSSYHSGGWGLRVGVGKSASAALPLDVIVPTTTLLQGCGHWIDCRPAANADPYLIVSGLGATVHDRSIAVPSELMTQRQHEHHVGLSSPKSMFAHTLGSSASHASALHSHMDDSSSSWSLDDSDDTDTSTMNSEDVLIDELDRIDGCRPGNSPQKHVSRQHMDDDECCSSGSSPVLPDHYAVHCV